MKLSLLVVMVIAIGLLFHSGCKTAEEAWTLNMTGSWNFDFNAPSISPPNWTNNLTFSGGSISGNIRTYVGETGTYTVSGGTVTMNWTFLCGCSANTTWDLVGTASESNPNYLSGSGSWYHSPGPADALTFTAIRL